MIYSAYLFIVYICEQWQDTKKKQLSNLILEVFLAIKNLFADLI